GLRTPLRSPDARLRERPLKSQPGRALRVPSSSLPIRHLIRSGTTLPPTDPTVRSLCMQESPTEYLALLRRCVEQTESALQQTDDPGRRAAAVAGGLRILWPTSPLFACGLGLRGSHLRAFDQRN